MFVSEAEDNIAPKILESHFERVKFTDGHLFVLKLIPSDLPPNFQELLSTETPWKKNGTPLNWKGAGGQEISNSTRKVEKCLVGTTEVVVKEMVYSTRSVFKEKNTLGTKDA